MTVEIAAWVIRTIEFGGGGGIYIISLFFYFFFFLFSWDNKTQQVSIALFAYFQILTFQAKTTIRV